jgi:cysteine sulfinate desulfinase/cysteine desulfurase-like protein
MGAVHPDDVVASLRPNTSLVSVMLVNNETGCIADIRAIVDGIRKWEADLPAEPSRRKITVHTDAAQAVGKMPVNVKDMAVDMLTIVGHKLYAPRIGALYVRGLHERGFNAEVEIQSEVPLFPSIFGGGQEKGYRSGTENVPQCAGLGAAADLVSSHVNRIAAKNRELISLFEKQIREKALPGFEIAIHGEQNPWGRVGNVVMFSVLRLKNGSLDPSLPDNSALAARLIERGFIIGKGAACHPDGSASGVLAAMGVDPLIAKTALRLSVGLWSTKQDVEGFVEAFWDTVAGTA